MSAPASPLWYEPLLDHGLLPDALLRLAVRRLLHDRLAQEEQGSPAALLQRKLAYVNRLRAAPIAVHTAAANAQHYEVPADFYHLCLGPRKKYSACLFPPGSVSHSVLFWGRWLRSDRFLAPPALLSLLRHPALRSISIMALNSIN
jgi:hypothetical protein